MARIDENGGIWVSSDDIAKIFNTTPEKVEAVIEAGVVSGDIDDVTDYENLQDKESNKPAEHVDIRALFKDDEECLKSLGAALGVKFGFTKEENSITKPDNMPAEEKEEIINLFSKMEKGDYEALQEILRRARDIAVKYGFQKE